MKQIDIKGKSKLICLKAKRQAHSFFSGLTSKLSIIIALFCLVVNLWILVPNLFNRSPVISYFTHKLELPMTYVMQGSVRIVDCEGNLFNNSVIIHVGGYRKRIDSSVDYDLKFTSPKNKSFFVVITYKDHSGMESTYTKEIPIPDEGNVIQENFVIYG